MEIFAVIYLGTDCDIEGNFVVKDKDFEKDN